MDEILADFRAAFVATDRVPAAMQFPPLTPPERAELLARLAHLQAALDDYTRDLNTHMHGISSQIRMVRKTLPARLAYARTASLAFNPERRN